MRDTLLSAHLGPRARRVNRYRIQTSASASRAYEAALNVSLLEVPVVRWLFDLRGIPYRPEMTMREFFSTGSFRIFAADPPREVVFGIERLHLRALGNFRTVTTVSGTVLSTETWVETTTPQADRAFRLYWAVVAPFSGLIRRVLLGAAKRRAEQAG